MSDVRGILTNQVRGLGLSWSAAWSFRGELKPHRRALATGLVAALGFTVARVAEPWPLKWIFDYALAGHTPDTAWPTLNAWLAGGPLQVTALAVAAIVGLAVVRGMFDAWQVTITSQVGYRVLAAVRERTFAHLQRLPLAYHVGSRTGDLLTRLMSDVQVLRDVLVSSLFAPIAWCDPPRPGRAGSGAGVGDRPRGAVRRRTGRRGWPPSRDRARWRRTWRWRQVSRRRPCARAGRRGPGIPAGSPAADAGAAGGPRGTGGCPWCCALAAQPKSCAARPPERRSCATRRPTATRCTARSTAAVSLADVATWTGQLRGAGLATPGVAAWLPEDGLLLQHEAPGRPLRALRGDVAHGNWMAPTAELLGQLQAAPVPEPRPADRDGMAWVSVAARAVAALVPAAARDAERTARRITAALAAVGPATTLVHGDFYDDQVLVSDAGVWLLDLDELSVGHPLWDVGNHLAHLAADGVDRTADRASFLSAYTDHRPAPAAEVAAFEAACQLALAVRPFRHLEPDWPAAVAERLARAEAVLDTTGPRWAGTSTPAATPPLPAPQPSPGDAALARIEGLPGPGAAALAALEPSPSWRDPASAASVSSPASRDPALQALDSLLDPHTAGLVLSSGVGRPVAVTAVDLVRHKPGRRAVLRFRLRADGAGEELLYGKVLYGKLFASQRGPRVQAITAQLAASLACGPNVSLPHPVAYLSEPRLLLLTAVPGQPAEAAFAANGVALAVQVAEAIARLHAAPVDLGRRHDLARELAPLPEQVARLNRVDSELGQVATACLRDVETLSRWPGHWRSLPIHRDFYPAQVLTDGQRLGIVNLDDAAMGEPAVDVANFLAHLALMALGHPDRAGAVRRTARAFLAAYQAFGEPLDHRLLAFLEATTLLRLAGIHCERPGGKTLAAGLLHGCSERLVALTGANCATTRDFSRTEAT